VYKGRLREGGRSVAVKIQRPGVRDAIALDVFILRWLAGRLRTLRRLNSDLPRLLDEWASSLFRELDYRQEASNGARFAELYADMEVRALFSS
jgi:aarF domain-containing kinase